MDGNESVSQLLVQLPQAKSTTETFGLFASTVHSLFQGLQHIRYAGHSHESQSALQEVMAIC
jgi:hypothetical protein